MKTKISILDKIAIAFFFVLLIIAMLCFTVKKVKAIANSTYSSVITFKS